MIDNFVLLDAYQQTSNSVQKKNEVFRIHELLTNLGHDLATGAYRPGRYNCFVVKDPKMREIFAPGFRDRIVHRVIVDRLMAFFDKRFIDDSFSNRKSGGTHAAID